VLVALLLLALGCLLGTGFLYIQARQRVSALSNLVPLRETVVVRADAPTVVRQVQGLSKLETSRYTMEKILDAERSRRFVPEWLAGEKLVFVAHGEVVAGLDLSKLGEGDVQVSGDAVTLRLPEPEILYSRLDNEKSYVYNRDTGILSRQDKDLESKVRATAEEQLRASAVEDGILKEARENGEKSLAVLLASMGYKDVRFADDEP
jgi:hypothetical protein